MRQRSIGSHLASVIARFLLFTPAFHDFQKFVLDGIRFQYSYIRQPHLESLSDFPKVSHLQADDQRTVGFCLPDLLRREDLPALEVVGRLRVHLDEHFQVALLAEPDVGALPKQLVEVGGNGGEALGEHLELFELVQGVALDDARAVLPGHEVPEAVVVDDPVGVDGGRVGVDRGVVEGDAPSVADGLEEPVHEPGVEGHRLVDVDVDGLGGRGLVEAVEDLVGGLLEGLAQLGDGALEGDDEGQLVFVEELEILEDILVQPVDAGACLGHGEAALLQE